MSIKPPRILICGAYSTGKTTAVELAASRMRVRGVQTTICTDVARACPFSLNREQALSTTIWLAATQISAEIMAEAEQPDLVLCDRGLPDILSHHVVDHSGDSGRLTTAFLQYARAWTETYDAILLSLIDPDLTIVPDGLRVVDEAYRRSLQDALVRELRSCDVSIRTLPLDPEARASFIEDTYRLIMS